MPPSPSHVTRRIDFGIVSAGGDDRGAHEGQLDKDLVDGGGEISPRKWLCDKHSFSIEFPLITH